MRCTRCGSTMESIMHFEEQKDFAYHWCKKCKQKTHQKRINYEQFEKGKVYELKK